MTQRFTPGPTWPGSGINYGNDRAFSIYFDPIKITNELRFLRRYFTKLRVFIPHYGYGTTHSIVTNCLFIIDQAVSVGFTEIIWGITCSEATLSATTYNDYLTAATARAIVAKNHGVTTFVVGNEEEYHVDGSSLTRAQIEAHVRSDLYTAVKIAFTGTVSYNLPAGVLSDWLANGKGSLDTIGMNVYGNSEYDGAGFCRDVRNFYNAFGPSSYISEYGLHYDWTAVTMTPLNQYRELRKRHDFIKRIGLSSGYFFLYSHLSDDHFAVRLANGQYRYMWQALVSERFAWIGEPNTQIYTLRRVKQ
jgi:hypothetical protein